MLRVVVKDLTAWPSIPFEKITVGGVIGELRSKAILAVDIKTKGLDPNEDSIEAMTICTPAEEIYVFTPETIQNSTLREFMNHKSLIVHSGLKDISFLMAKGVMPASVVDTCLCDMVVNNFVEDDEIQYDLPSVLDRYDIVNTFNAYPNGLFWKEGFNVGGINYLSIFVRYLFELKNKIYFRNASCTNLFRSLSSDLLIAAQMNVCPIPISLEALSTRKDDVLENIVDLEASMYTAFRTICDSPGPLKHELSIPDANEAVEPLFDIDNKKEIERFFDRCDANEELFPAYEIGMIDEVPNAVTFDEYRRLIHRYNDVLRRVSITQDNTLLYSHYVTMSRGDLGIKCIPNFPRPTFAKRKGIPTAAARTLDPYNAIIREGVDGAEESGYSLNLVEVFDIVAFGMGLLCGDKCALRLALNKEDELKMLKEQLEMTGVNITKRTNLRALMSMIFGSGLLINKDTLIMNGIDPAHTSVVSGIITKRYNKCAEAISGLISRLTQSGNAMIFGEYPIAWKTQGWVREMKARMTEDFWSSYGPHAQARDDVFMQVQRYYKEIARAQSFVRRKFVNYIKHFVLSSIMGTFSANIAIMDLRDIIQFVACDETSFILMYPQICEENAESLITTSINQLERRLGEKLPITTTIV